MTSRNLYCSLLKESMKRRLWNIALIFLSFFFVLPVAMIYSMGEQRSFDTEVQWLEYKIRQASNLVSVNNGILVFVMITFAVICGISSFSFLHSRKKTDFYHSLPIRRETWFWVNFVSGVLMTALIYGLHLVIACAVAGINGVPMGELMQTAALGYAFHMVYFFLMYTVVVIAMMLTGNLVVAVLGVSQFFVYGIFLLGMILNYFSIWFVTYFTRSGEGLTEWMYRLSPAAAYIHGMYVFEEEQRIAGTLLIPLAVTAVGIAVALWLYTKRPSEAAGKALAFSRTQSVIRCMIVVLCGMIGIWFFWQLRARTSWAVFGLLCGCVISHCTIEIIYHFDFRKLFSHKIQLAGCMVLTFLIFGCFRFDWFGYDTYVPDAGQVESIALRVDGDTDYDLYNVPEWMERSGGYYYWSSNPNQFIKEHMILTDVEPVLKIVQAGIDRNQRRQEELG
ncbi:MAG: ABC transporter permease, partial [Lachnospiraceae bacterium]